MSNLSISQLPSSSGLTGTEVLPIVQSGTTVQTTVQDVANLGGGIMAVGTGTGSTVRINNNNSALSPYSTVSGGENNTISEGNVGVIDDYYNETYSGNTLDGDFFDISPSSTLSGLGSGAWFDIGFFEGTLNNIITRFGGSNYVQGDTLTFDGALFGGESGVDDVTLQIDTISQGSSYSTIGGGQNNTIIGFVGVIVGYGNYFFSGNLNGTFPNISPTSTSSGLGSGATFNFDFSEGIFNGANIQSGGSNYVSGDEVTFDGTLFGGVSGTDDVVLQINTTSTGGIYSTIGGGGLNTASGYGSTIGGGTSNAASGYESTIGGGEYNTASANDSTIGGGISNTASGSRSTVSGGRLNTASGYCSTIGGGFRNVASGILSTIDGGRCNISIGRCSVIGGGSNNRVNNNLSTIGGGQNNSIGVLGVIDGYFNESYTGNTLDGTFSNISPSSTSSGLGTDAEFNFEFIEGTLDNVIIQLGGSNYVQGDTLTFDGTEFGGESGVDDVTLKIETTSIGDSSTIGGGCSNTASGDNSTIGGGGRNTASGSRSTVGGGGLNTASGYRSTIGGGYGNTSSCYNSTIGGGRQNTASGRYSTIGGGRDNTSFGYYSTIGGGNLNTSGIVGVIDNTFNIIYTGNPSYNTFSSISPSSTSSGLGSGASFEFSFNGGLDNVNIQFGGSNYVNGDTLTFDGTLFGGESGTDDVTFQIDTISIGTLSTVGGGCSNTTCGDFSTVSGGRGNTASGYNSTIGGGRFNRAGIIGYIDGTFNQIYTGNSLNGVFFNISPSSTSSGLGSGARFYVSFTEGVLDFADIQLGGSNYVNGDTLTFNGTLFGGVSGVDDVTTQIITISIGDSSTIGGGRLNTASGGYSTIGGGFCNTSYGGNSTVGGGSRNTSECSSTVGGGICNLSSFFGTVGGGNTNAAYGSHSTIGGGRLNTATGSRSTIGGGQQNTSSGYYSIIGGGRFNSTSGCYSTIGGGFCNTESGYISTIGGGRCNTVSDSYSTVGGGRYNTASGFGSTIGGGSDNTSSCSYSTVGGGRSNCASNYSSTIGGGRYNTASGNYSTIGGGCLNTASACNSAILGGICNNTGNCNCAMIVGSCITADMSNTTFVNCLSIKNIPTSPLGLCPGMVWKDLDGSLKII
jgi:hypothetical protein